MKERGVAMECIDADVVIEAADRGLAACCVCVGAIKGGGVTRVDLVLDRTEQGWLLAWVERVRARRAAALRDDGCGGGEKRFGKVADRVVGGDRTNRCKRAEEDHS